MRHLLKLSVPAIAVSLMLSACGSSSSSKASSSAASVAPAAQTSANASASSGLVKTASNSTLGAVLVDSKGMTLYHLSGEQNGKFICTSSACVGVWHPLTAPSGGAPISGAVGSLGTVKRPDGTTQVTYMGTPLYTFAQDQQPGDAKGQGIKDVGTWSAVTTGAGATSAASTSNTSAPATESSTSTSAPPAESSGGGGYAY
jgi:predicted lipoprotein with Yx(FWY)xxD motif